MDYVRDHRNSKTIIDGKGAKKISKIIQQYYTKKLDFWIIDLIKSSEVTGEESV